jgi:hypothetical protein
MPRSESPSVFPPIFGGRLGIGRRLVISAWQGVQKKKDEEEHAKKSGQIKELGRKM